jgi:hypothetical protein
MVGSGETTLAYRFGPTFELSELAVDPLESGAVEKGVPGIGSFRSATWLLSLGRLLTFIVPASFTSPAVPAVCSCDGLVLPVGEFVCVKAEALAKKARGRDEATSKNMMNRLETIPRRAPAIPLRLHVILTLLR